MDLSEISAGIRKRLDAKSAAREKGLTASRAAIRFCANSIRAVHRGEMELARELQGQAREQLDAARAAMKPYPDIYHAGFLHDAEGLSAVHDHPEIRFAGYLQDAQKEYAEARITEAVVTGSGRLPTPEEVGVEDAPFLNGMAEAIGEGRRHILDLLRHGEVDRGEAILSAMDDIYYVLVSMDYPDAITGGLRRSTDVARSIMERSRGDLSITIVQRGVQEAIERARKDISG